MEVNIENRKALMLFRFFLFAKCSCFVIFKIDFLEIRIFSAISFFVKFTVLEFGIWENWNFHSFLGLFFGFSGDSVNNLSALTWNLTDI